MNIWGAVEMDGKELLTALLGVVLGAAGLWVGLVLWLGSL